MTTPLSEASRVDHKPWDAAPQLVHDDPLLACLVEITRLHGHACSADALSAGLPFVDHKLTPSLLPRAAARAHCSARIVRRQLAALPDELLPAILLLEGGRACVLLERRADVYVVQYSEAASPMQVQTATLAAEYSGLACFIRPHFRFEARARQATQARSSHWFWAAILDNWRLYRDAIVAALLINIFALALPLYTMNVYDRVIPNNAVETLWVLSIGIALVLVFNLVLSSIRSYVVDIASKRVDIGLSARIMERVLDLRMENRPVSVGSFAANLRSFESVRDFIASASLVTLVDLPFIFLFLIVLAWISPWLVLPPVIAIVVILGMSYIAQARMEALVLDSFQASAQRNAGLVESLSGLETIKALNAQSGAQRNWERSTQFLAHLGARIKLISSITVGMVQTAQQLVTVSVVIIGAYLIQEAQLSLGGIIAASMIAGRCLAPLGQVAGLMMQYQNARTALNSIDGYMQMPVERPAEKQFVPRPFLQGAIEFRQVAFGYPGARQASLRNISFKIAAGEKVGIVGRIGSGKTTLEKLILGLYQPSEGAILVDGIDTQQIDSADLRRAIGYVPQDPMLFYGTLKHNITMGAPYADDAALFAAAHIAGIDDHVNQHPDGYDMLVGERGDSLSGGQRQEVAIARALINNPPILLLDEPSSNMDNQTESALRARLKEACVDKTVVLITHRTALLDIVDRLIVIDNGKIVADGPKDQIVEALRAGRIGKAKDRA
ncbi:type I secretion system permease/ATPase [Alcaligenaceae bacterium]|nr:type I secretion system permease/ATPase [Alcaligenaceae bacterium]